MPPKTAGAESDTVNSVVALCHLMANCTEFKADTSKLAGVFGISHSKNVPRKINGIINPHGFEFREGKVFAKDGNAIVPATPTKKSAKEKDQKQTGIKSDSTSNTPTGGKKRSTPASKKRKLQAAEVDPPVDDGESSAEDGNGKTSNSADSGDSNIVVDTEHD